MTLKEEIAWCKAQIKAGGDAVALRSILKRLQGLGRQSEPVPPHYQEAVLLYKQFLSKQGLPAVFTAIDGKHLKELLGKLKGVSTDRTDEAALQSLQAIFANWHKAGDYLGRQKSLAAINRNLIELIDKIKHGANKKLANTATAERMAAAIANKYNQGNS